MMKRMLTIKDANPCPLCGSKKGIDGTSASLYHELMDRFKVAFISLECIDCGISLGDRDYDLHDYNIRIDRLVRKWNRLRAEPGKDDYERQEHCTDCKEYDQERHCCPRYSNVIRQAVEELKIVHCIDCVYWDRETHGCERNKSLDPWWESDSCSKGKRRKDERND